MEIRLEEIIESYRQLLYDLNHQLLCYKIANQKLEKENARLFREITELTEDPSQVSYTENE
jgi:hypothetical protein